MKNTYEIRGDVTAIFLNRKDGMVLECLIDTDDLEELLQFRTTWYARWSPKGRCYYVICSPWNRGKQKNVPLHRWLTKAPDGLVVDHIDHNTLDNRRSNLRLATHAENLQNQRTYKNSSTGHSGVTWEKREQKYRAQIYLNKETMFLGYYSDLEEAANAVREAKANLVPFSQEALRRVAK